MLYLLITWLAVGIIWDLFAIVEMKLTDDKLEEDEKLPFIIGSIATIIAGPIVIPYSIWLVKHDD